MPSKTFYFDDTITVTTDEIRFPNGMILIESVTAIGVQSVQPFRWAFLGAIPAVLLGVVFFALFGGTSILGGLTLMFALPGLFLLFLLLAAGLVRISVLRIQTTGGPMVIARHIDFGSGEDSQLRLNSIRQAIESALASRTK